MNFGQGKVREFYFRLRVGTLTRPIELKFHMTNPYDWLVEFVHIVMVT